MSAVDPGQTKESVLSVANYLNFNDNDLNLYHTIPNRVQRILLEQPCLVSDHFNLATIITCPYQNEAKDIGHLKYLL